MEIKIMFLVCNTLGPQDLTTFVASTMEIFYSNLARYFCPDEAHFVKLMLKKEVEKKDREQRR